MTWGQEIFRALLLALGVTQIITNIIYLTKENGMDLARKQHTELPKNLPDNKVKIKVTMMLLSGMVLFVSSLSTYLLHNYNHNIMIIATVLFCVYGIIEALYYRYWKTFGFAFLTILFVIGSIFI